MSKTKSEKVSLILDMKGEECSTIRLELRIRILEIEKDNLIKLITDRPESVISLPKWCNLNGHELFLSDEKDGEYIFYIKRRI
ncbi:MAG: sulfurtransferase TusA family protein [Candidatus Heimdallarchaeota archaeon]|nr:sulfurtransferase TusA family protein [Candidatus Heimdallarchaeota archaeon]HUU78695.1 sulfurtransferase TusA family protein [candidate division Zixibacteria bacterium]